MRNPPNPRRNRALDEKLRPIAHPRTLGVALTKFERVRFALTGEFSCCCLFGSQNEYSVVLVGWSLAPCPSAQGPKRGTLGHLKKDCKLNAMFEHPTHMEKEDDDDDERI